ncbi:MAG TPA: hypothetical protein VFH27_17575 [Longimicrobiaceae bacterium]|nr:hypothetical protein [Longimicrobiaceae bacterium]
MHAHRYVSGFTLALFLLLGAAACDNTAPLSPAASPTIATPHPVQIPVVAGIICVGTVSPAKLDCGVPISYPGASTTIAVNASGGLIRVERQAVAYDAARGEFSFNLRAVNWARAQAIGTFDGTTPDSRGISVVVVSGPLVTRGAGTIRPLDAKVGSLAPYLPRNTAYYRYAEVVRPSGSTAWQRWRFAVPATVSTFRFELAIFTEVQPMVRISEVMPGLINNAGRLPAGGYFEVANVGQFDINDDVPGGAIWVLQDSAFTGKVGASRLYVHGPWKPGERRLVGDGRYAKTLLVPLDGAFGEGYWPSYQWGHAFKVRSGNGIVLDRLTMAIPRSRYDGYSFQKVNLMKPNHTIPDIWEWIPAQTRVGCKVRPCLPLWGTPRAAGY